MASAEALDAPTAGRAAGLGGAQRVAGFLAGNVLSIAAVALLFRHLGVADSGRYVTILTLVAIVQGLTDLGVGMIAMREGAATPEEGRRELLGDVLGLRLVATVAGVALAAAFALVAGLGAQGLAGVGLVGLALAIMNAGATTGFVAVLRLRAGLVAVADLVRQGFAAVLVVVAVTLGAGIVVFWALLVPAAVVGVAVITVATGTRLRPRWAPGRWRALLRQTVPLAIASAAGVLIFRAAMIEMSLLSSDRETGLFGASFRVVEVLGVLPGLAMSASFPVFSRAVVRGDDAQLRLDASRAFAVCTAAGGALALGLVLGAPAVVAIVAGGEFADAAPVLRIQGVALLASFWAVVPAYVLLAKGRERTLMWINIAGCVVLIVLAALLIELAAARGAALAIVLVDLAFMVAFLVLVARAGLRLSLEPAVRATAGLALGLAAGFALPAPSALQALAGLALYAAVVRPDRMLPRRGRR